MKSVKEAIFKPKYSSWKLFHDFPNKKLVHVQQLNEKYISTD